MKLELYKTLPDGAGNDLSPPPVARFTLDESRFAGKTFDVRLNACTKPTCHCELARLECHLEGVPEPIVFEVNVMRERLDTKIHSGPNQIALGKAFCKEANAEDWRWLRNAFVSAKRENMKTMDLDSVEVDLPDDVKQGRATTVGYMEIFPWAEMFHFARENEQWVVDDQYCVNPKCPCTRTFLTFFSAPNPPTSNKPRMRAVASYDYKTRKFEVEERRKNSPDPSDLMEIVTEAWPDLASMLRERHGQLRRIGRRFLPGATEGQERVPESSSIEPVTSSSPSLFPSPSTKRVSVKVGRNDSCPCGSGKKFKKCCGG